MSAGCSFEIRDFGWNFVGVTVLSHGMWSESETPIANLGRPL